MHTGFFILLVPFAYVIHVQHIQHEEDRSMCMRSAWDRYVSSLTLAHLRLLHLDVAPNLCSVVSLTSLS